MEMSVQTDENIDMNVIPDVLLKRAPFAKDAYAIFKMADEKVVTAYISAFAITDI
jgi:hypothetical protein